MSVYIHKFSKYLGTIYQTLFQVLQTQQCAKPQGPPHSVGFVCVPVLEHTAAPLLQGFSSHSLSYLVLTTVQKSIKGKSLETVDVL